MTFKKRENVLIGKDEVENKQLATNNTNSKQAAMMNGFSDEAKQWGNVCNASRTDPWGPFGNFVVCISGMEVGKGSPTIIGHQEAKQQTTMKYNFINFLQFLRNLWLI